MKKINRLLILAGFFLIFLNIGLIAAETCYITTSNNCVGNNKIVMRVSGTTNAHGALADQDNFPSNNVLCCDFGEGVTNCYGDDTIIGLSSETNAHAEIPDLASPNYNYKVCYDQHISC